MSIWTPRNAAMGDGVNESSAILDYRMTVALEKLRKIKKEKLRALLVPTEMINAGDPTGTAIMRIYKSKELKYLAWAL